MSRDYFKMKLQWGVVLVEDVPYLVETVQSPDIDPPEGLGRGSSLAQYTDWYKENMYLLLIDRDPVLFKDVQIIHPEDQYVKIGTTIHYLRRSMGKNYKIVPHGDSYGLTSRDMLRAITFIQNPTYRKKGLTVGIYSPQVAIVGNSLMYRDYFVGSIRDGSIRWERHVPDSILKELKGIFKVRNERVTKYKTETPTPPIASSIDRVLEELTAGRRAMEDL